MEAAVYFPTMHMKIHLTYLTETVGALLVVLTLAMVMPAAAQVTHEVIVPGTKNLPQTKYQINVPERQDSPVFTTPLEEQHQSWYTRWFLGPHCPVHMEFRCEDMDGYAVVSSRCFTGLAPEFIQLPDRFTAHAYSFDFPCSEVGDFMTREESQHFIDGCVLVVARQCRQRDAVFSEPGYLIQIP